MKKILITILLLATFGLTAQSNKEILEYKHKLAQLEYNLTQSIISDISKNRLLIAQLRLEIDSLKLIISNNQNNTTNPPDETDDTDNNTNVNPSGKVLAFPTARGAGAYATGGRGGVVVHVTNLNSSGAGSFEAALKMTVPRTIVFDVSGIITINPLLYLSAENSNLTIAGQTAPEGGITIDGGRLYLDDVENIIVRHIRFKGGIDADWVPNSGDNRGSASVTCVGKVVKHIWDHVSFSYGKTMPTWNPQGDDVVDEVTVQYCFFSETEKGAIIGKSVEHATGLKNFTFRNNAFYNCDWRFPNVGGNSDPETSIDVVNNLTWTSSGRLIRGAGNLNLNHINNVYYVGPYSLLRNTGVNLWSDDGGKWNPKIYTNGNIIIAPNVAGDINYSLEKMNVDNTLSWNYFVGNRYGASLPSSFFTDTMHKIKGESYNIIYANQLKESLQNNLGCNARLAADGTVNINYDIEDASYLANIKSDEFTRGLVTSAYNVISYVSKKRPSTFDTDRDGIPDTFEDENGTNKNDPLDGALISTNGYSNLENYLNKVDD